MYVEMLNNGKKMRTLLTYPFLQSLKVNERKSQGTITIMIIYSSHTSTTYFITFEFESEDRLEFRVSDKEFGMLAEEGDKGTLTIQGIRYIDFTRN